MRVLMLSWEYPPNVTGGLGSHLAGLTPALVRAGVEVDVIAPQSASPSPSSNGSVKVENEEEVTEDGVKVHRVPLAKDANNIYDQARMTNQSMRAKAQALLARGDHFDLIHAHDWLVVLSAYELKHEFRLPLIATIHATEQGRIRGGILRTDLQRNIHGAEWWLVYEAWRVITCSHYMAKEVQGFFRAPAEKIDVVPNGVELSTNGRCSAEDLASRRSQYASPERKIVFAVGRLVYEKGFHLLVNAIPRILSECPNTQFVIAGRGPEAVSLAQQASRLGVADHVMFPGFIADKERDCLYQLAACAVFPSLYEPFGIVALEAMATGCPVVVSEVGGLREVVRHGQTGITVYPDDAQSVALGVIATLRDPACAAARARQAKEVVYRDFNWDTIAAQTIVVYQRVIRERQGIDW